MNEEQYQLWVEQQEAKEQLSTQRDEHLQFLQDNINENGTAKNTLEETTEP